jgi:hypothetical protein
MAKYYFASEGNYGVLDEASVVCDTSQWTMADWEEVENCMDSERSFVARGVANKYRASN